MKLLALDTATENCSAALLIDATIRYREVEMERGHAERILPMIDDLLSEAGLSLTNLDAIAFGRGPGSFTGVRLAATVTQGLAFGANLGVIPISDLQAVAQRAFVADPTLSRALVCNDARMGEVYWACYEKGEGGLARLEGEERVSKPSEVRLPAGWSTATPIPAGDVTAAVAPVGRGFIAYADALPQAVDNSLLRFLPHAREIAQLAVPELAAGRLLPPEAAVPIYLRDNVAHVAQPPRPPGQGR